MSLRTRRGVALLASLVFVGAACQPGAPAPATGQPGGQSPGAPTAGQSPAGPQSPEDLLFKHAYAPEQGTPGGNVVISDWQAANQLNYYYSNAFANSQVLAVTMRSLAVVTHDGHWKEDLAAKLPRFSDNSVREDAQAGTGCPPKAGAGGSPAASPASPSPSPAAVKGFSVDLAIKPNLKWSDGETLDLNDLRYTWQWVMDPAQEGITTLGWDRIDRFDVGADGLTATVHFCEPYAGYFGTLLGSPLLPEHYMTTIPVAEANKRSYPMSADIAKAPVSGPFKYVTASADTIELERNENWASARDRAAYLDRVTFRFFPDNKEGMIAAFKAGEVDVATNLLQGDYDAIKDVDPATGKALVEAAWEYEHFDMNQAGAGPGKGHPALKDFEVRKAIAQAIDRTALYQAVFPGQPLPPAEQTVCTNAPPGTYWRLGQGLECPAFDQNAAIQTLEAAGYRDTDGDGIREDKGGGGPLRFTHCTSQVPAREASGNFLARELKKIGIQLDVNLVDSTTVLFANWPDVAADTKCNLAHGNYDTSEFAYVLTFDLFGNYYYSYHTEQIPTEQNEGNGYNYLRYSNPQMDEALNTLKSAIRPEQQVEAAYTVQRVYVEQIPEVVLYYRASTRGVSAKLRNFFKNPSTSSDMWNIEDWFLAQ